MESVLLVIHLFLALAIIGLVLIQRSEGGGLGIGGGGGGLGGLATPKGTGNLLTRMTAICAGLFFTTSVILGILAGSHTKANQGLMDALQQTPAAQEAPVVPAVPAPATENKTPAAPAPAAPAPLSVPVAK